VETALRIGAKIVWLPTLTSRQDQLNGIGEALGIPGPGLSVVDDDGSLSPETHDVLDLVAEHGAVLATGHVTWAEHLEVTKEFGRRGKVVVTHAMEELAGPNLSVEQCVELADLGATIELCALTCLGALATRPTSAMAAAVNVIGAERCTLATDYGQKANVRPAPGFQDFADALLAEGLDERAVRRMACDNPCALLGLAAQPAT
jgi:microsomal dipeptidase-like Zn-dependent dipeptidase